MKDDVVRPFAQQELIYSRVDKQELSLFTSKTSQSRQMKFLKNLTVGKQCVNACE